MSTTAPPPPEPGKPPVRLRRPPPEFRPVTVRRIEPVGARLARVTFTGAALEGFAQPDPAASVRLLLPSPGSGGLVLPGWNGNEFRLPDGTRPAIRTFTPVRFDLDARELDLDVVRHGHGAASEWVDHAGPGEEAAVSGPGRGYTVVVDAPAYAVGGDESAVPAIRQLLERIPDTVPVSVDIEVAAPEGRSPLPVHPHAIVTWHDLDPGDPPGHALVAALTERAIVPGARIWVAGEAAAVQRIRRHFFDTLGVARPLTSVRGYWKHGRSGDSDDEGPA